VIQAYLNAPKFWARLAGKPKLERLRYRFALGGKDFVVTLPGRLAAEKNHVCLVKAVESTALFLFWEATKGVCSPACVPVRESLYETC